MTKKTNTPSSTVPLTHQRTSKVEVSINQQKVDLLPHEQDESIYNHYLRSAPSALTPGFSRPIRRPVSALHHPAAGHVPLLG